jgi:hypothetical protein
MRAIVLGSLLLAGCGGAASPSTTPPPAPVPLPATASARPPVAAAPRYAATFETLLRRIERDHVFPPGYVRDVGHRFQDDVPRLRREFERAKDRAEALAALRHLQHALRDLHCYLDPPADMRRGSVKLGVRLWAGGTEAAPDVRVAEVLDPELASKVAVGDVVTSVDGAPLATWLASHPFDAQALSPERHYADTIVRITYAELPWVAVKEGDTRRLGLSRDGRAREVDLDFRREFPGKPTADLDDPPPMAKVECDAANPLEYGDYVLGAMGANVCVYLPRKPGKPRVPVVRYTSFLYGGNGDGAQALRMVRVDHDVLARTLRDADGVIVDVHDNHGGNNPFLFAGWLSPGPWDHERVVTRVVPELDAATIARVLFGESHVAEYVAAQKAHQPTVLSRFLCAPGKCDQVRPAPSELVTRAPVALIVGPGCVSSCDTLAATWSAFKLGPVVGRQPAHAYTVIRVPIHVSGPDSQDLGTFRVAISQSEFREGVSIEGEPLHLDWEAPSTFETRASWVKRAVDEARARLVKR